MTALKNDDGRVRGIVAGSVLRRLVCKAIARQFAAKVLQATAPFQFALQTRAGTEALAHLLRYFTDRDPDTVIVSLDGIGAFDHVKRAAFMRKIVDTPELESILPLVRALYSTESRFYWFDDEGHRHTVCQAEGGEQGDPLMPALYSLAQHDSLVEADGSLLPQERLLSFLDDLYIVTSRDKSPGSHQYSHLSSGSRRWGEESSGEAEGMVHRRRSCTTRPSGGQPKGMGSG